MSAEAAPRTARKRKTRWAIGILAAVVVIALAAFATPMVLRATTKQAEPVATTTVASGQLVISASADGATEAEQEWEVYPEVGGTVAAVQVAVGDTVKSGDTLFTIDDTDLQSALRQASAQLKQANQQVASSKQQVESAELAVMRAENALDSLESRPASMAASSAQIEEATQDIVVAEAGLANAKAGLASANTAKSNASTSYSEAKADLDAVTVTAPSDGVVTALSVSEGGSVSAGGGSGSSSGGGTTAGTTGSTGSSAPVVISDTGSLKVVVGVNEVDIADVKAGQVATVTFDAIEDLEIPGKVTWVSPNSGSDGSVTTYEVELTLSKQDARLRTGMTATADIVTVTVTDALLVPKSSVKVDGTTKYVTVVKTDGTQEKRTVTTGPSDDTRVQVLTGLSQGEKITTTASSSSSEDSGRGFMMGGPPPGAGGGGAGGAGGGR